MDDAPTGTYKSHVLSSELIKASIADTKVMPYCVPVKGYGQNKGETVTYPRVSNLDVPDSAETPETTLVPEDTLSLSTGSITVKEITRALKWTGLAQALSPVDIPSTSKGVLQDQMTLYLDRMAMVNGFKAAKICATPTAATTVAFDTDGTCSNTATVNANYYLLESVIDYLDGTLNAKPYAGDDFICLGNTLFCRGIMRDPQFQEWNKYTTPEAKANGEIGKVEGMRIIKVNNTLPLENVGTNDVLGEAVVFGARPVQMAVAVPPHLRMKTPEDYGRQCGCAWYGVINFGPTWDTSNPGEATIVRITSA